MRIDTRSLALFIATLPRVPESIDWLLAMPTIRNESSMKSVIRMQLTRGCLGSWPIGREGELIVAVRLLPGRSIEECPIVHTMAEMVDPLTIAPHLAYTIAGRLAQVDAASPAYPVNEEMRAPLIVLAQEFGDDFATARVFDRIPEARNETPQQKRSAALFGAMDAQIPWCKVMQAAWSLSGEALLPWVDEAIRMYADEPITQRLYVASHVTHKTGRDVSDVAWRLIEGDVVYDANYTGDILGPAFGLWSQNALAQAVEVVESQVPSQPPLRRTLWQAHHAFVTSPEKYDGRLHLAIARELADSDPIAAYTQVCNAAACAARADSKKTRDAVAVAMQLARTNRWSQIEEALSAN